MPTQSPAIQCTTVEFAFLASLLGAATLTALPEAMQQWPASALDVAAAQVQARLAGRGLIVVQPDGSVQVAKSVAAIVGTCSAAQATFVATYTSAEGELVARQFHMIQSSAVELVVTDGDTEPVCELTALEGAAEVVERLASIFRLRYQQGPAVPNGSLRERSLRQARSLARDSGAEAAESYLVCCGLHPETAAALAETMDRPAGNGALLVLTQEGGQVATDGMGILEGENGLWLLRTADRYGSKWVDVVPCSAVAMQEFIRAMVGRVLISSMF